MCSRASVCWFRRTQKYATLPTSEVEYVALGLFLRQGWRFMLPGKGMPCFLVFDDNQGAVQLAQNPVTNSNSRHIDVRYHLEYSSTRGHISNTLPSEYQHADILTKAVVDNVFVAHRNQGTS